MRQPKEILEPDFIRVGVCINIPLVLWDFGIDAEKFINDFGLDKNVFQDADNLILYSTLSEFLTACARVTECEAFGVLVGQRASLDVLGYLGAAMRHSINVGDALKTAVRLIKSYDRGSFLDLATLNEYAEIRCITTSTAVKNAEQIIDGTIAVCCSLMKEMCGSTWTPTAISLPRRVPNQIESFVAAFPCRVSFDRPFGAVRFNRAWLSVTLPGAKTPAHHDFGKAGPDELTEHVISVCMRCMLAKSIVTSDDIALAMGMTRRTLHRRLADAGTTFRVLLNKTRFNFACRLLTDTDMKITAIAIQLGYSELAAFTRSFRVFSGQTPTEYRLSNRSVDAP